MLNLIDLREGDFIDRRTLERNTLRLERSQLLETNPQIADPPDIKVIPRDEADQRVATDATRNDKPLSRRNGRND